MQSKDNGEAQRQCCAAEDGVATAELEPTRDAIAPHECPLALAAPS